MVDLLILTTLDQLILILKYHLPLLQMGRSTVLSLPLKLVFPARANASLHYENLVRSKMAHKQNVQNKNSCNYFDPHHFVLA